MHRASLPTPMATLTPFRISAAHAQHRGAQFNVYTCPTAPWLTAEGRRARRSLGMWTGRCRCSRRPALNARYGMAIFKKKKPRRNNSADGCICWRPRGQVFYKMMKNPVSPRPDAAVPAGMGPQHITREVLEHLTACLTLRWRTASSSPARPGNFAFVLINKHIPPACWDTRVQGTGATNTAAQRRRCAAGRGAVTLPAPGGCLPAHGFDSAPYNDWGFAYHASPRTAPK